MRFILQNYVLCLSSAGIAIFLAFNSNKIENVDRNFFRILEGKKAQAALIVAFSLFLLIYYVLNPVYYIHYFGGTLGDNFNYVRLGVIDPNYLNPQHFYFPFVPAQLFKAALSAGLFSTNDPNFPMQAFSFMSLPNRLFSLVGLWFSYRLFRKLQLNAVQSFLCVIFLAVSFGYWLWSLQSNAMGFLVAFVPISLYAHILAYDNKKIGNYVLAGGLASVCMFIHISSFYFCLGMVVFTLASEGLEYFRKKDLASLKCAGAYGVTGVIFGLIYYLVTSVVLDTFNPIAAFRKISDFGMFGGFYLNSSIFTRLIKDGISTNLSLILGPVQASSGSIIEKIAIFTSLGLIVMLAISINWGRLSRPWKEDKGMLLISFLFVFVVFGFSLRKTWPQYYSSISSLAAIFVLLVVFKYGRNDRFRYRNLSVGCIILLMIYLNGFSSTRATAGNRPGSNYVYAVLNSLKLEHGGKKVLYIGKTYTYPYNFSSMYEYFHGQKYFKNIDWSEFLPSQGELNALHQKYDEIIVNSEDYPGLGT